MAAPQPRRPALAPEASPVPIVPGLAGALDGIDALFCDVWGVVHDGVAALPGAGEALARARARGLAVVLVSNAPRPAAEVGRQLDALGVARDAYDAIVTSGDVTRALMEARGDAPCFHLGPARDENLFDGLPVPRVGPEDAAYVLCSGLVDDEAETAEDYRPLLASLASRELSLICANPDLVVERGHRLLPCAGALAALYEALGGRALYAGKPHAPIYARAAEVARRVLGRGVEPGRVLGIGDALRTDVAGALAYGARALLVLRGIHAAEAGSGEGAFDEAAARVFLARAEPRPDAAVLALGW